MVQVAQEIRRGGSSVTAEPALQVRDLSVSYAGAVQALRGVSLSVPEGAVLAVLGNNGAGKSTLLRAVSGTLSEHDTARSSVLLPAPLFPSTASTAPSGTESDTPRSAWTAPA